MTKPRPQVAIKGENPHAKIANICKPLDLFLARLAREGLLHEYTLARRKHISNGNDASRVNQRVRKDFGYLGQLGEREAYRDFLADEPPDVKKHSAGERMARTREKARNKPFEDAFHGLPDKASVEIETDWVRSHPAMARKARVSVRANSTGDTILITPEDLLSPPHGPCPSKCAANMLQNWVSQPEKFFNSILAEQKKGLKGQKSEKEGSEEEECETVADIDLLMESMKEGSA